VREKKDEGFLSINIRLKKGLEVKTSYGYGRVKNMGNIPAEDRKINTIIGMITYTF